MGVEARRAFQAWCSLSILKGLRHVRYIVELPFQSPDFNPEFLENKLITRHKLSFVLLGLLLGLGSTIAQAGDVQQDARAIDVLKQMAAHKSSLDKI